MKAHHAWAVLLAGVIAYELIADEGQLMSEGVDRAIDRHPILTRVAIVVVALHLINALPPALDPLHRSATYSSQKRRKP